MERKLVVIYAIFAGAVLIASSATIMYDQALGTVAISGQTRSGSYWLSYTYVSAEASGGHYHSVIADGLGFWTLPVDNGISYTVDASKFVYNRGRVTGVVGPQSGITHTLSLQTPQYTIEFFIVADEEFRSTYGSSWQTTAKNKLFAAKPYFENQHNIKFKDQYYYTTWDSNDSNGTCAMLNEAKSETGWNGGTRQGANVLWVVSGQHINGQPVGCADQPGSSGQYPGSIALDYATDYSDHVMHEVSHNFGLAHHSDTWFCIMNIEGYDNKNWKPTHDNLMQSHRDWY